MTTYCETHGVNLVQSERCMLCERGVELWVHGSKLKWTTDGGGEREATSAEVMFWTEITEAWAAINGNPPPSAS
jgi:hypothetical protein